MTKLELERLLKELNYEGQVQSNSRGDGLHAEWSSDGNLQRLKLIFGGNAVGWSIYQATSEASAKIMREGTWTFADTRLRDEHGNPEEPLNAWLKRWVTAVVRHAQDLIICSFCEKTSKEVKAMVPGTPGTFICDLCALLIADLIRDQAQT
jgi:hypothetical protein